jgi:uncharacterized protein (UPF0335 family)
MPTNAVGSRLLSFIERIENVEEEIKALRDDVKDIKQEAKSAGFDPKIINLLIKERKMAPHERAEQEQLLEVYRAAIGQLDGTPLGDEARRRVAGEEPNVSESGTNQDRKQNESIAAAQDVGRRAALNGDTIFTNPYPNGDPRRSAWDEAFCAELGTDEMGVPITLRSKGKKKDAEDEDREAA